MIEIIKTERKDMPYTLILNSGSYFFSEKAMEELEHKINQILSLSKTERELRLEEGIKRVANEIRAEINSRPGKPNVGKKGCLARIEALLD